MTKEELAKYTGKNGQPAYVAVGGIIYDVSASALWPQGEHEGSHQAGHDLTEELKRAPHVAAIVERFPSIGKLEETPAQKTSGLPKVGVAVAGIILLLLAWLILRSVN